MNERHAVEAAIKALQAQRALLGDTVVDTALGPLRERLALLTSPLPGAVPEQALRQVSVLFLDVVGSTALSQQLEPEDVHAVMDGVLVRCTAVVVAHGGKVLQYAGDNLLAAFGAERASEDDAERAVRCGLALLAEGRLLREQVHKEHGRDGCDVRVGIHTGPVLLGGGVDEAGTIRGLTVNIAARMEQTAPPGALRISQDTWALVRGVFDVQAQPPLFVKGQDEAMPTYLVQQAKPRAFRVPARAIAGVLAPMVGRDAELALLLAMVDQVVAKRSLGAITLIGEPGLGKSRLLHELQGALESHQERFWLLLGRANPASRLQPYGLLRDLLAWRLQIADSDSGEQAKTKLVDGLMPWLSLREGAGPAADPVQLEAQAHRIGQLIGLDFSASPHVLGLEPRLLRTLAFAALADYLRGLAMGGAQLAMLVEDLHWADDGSLDFIGELMQREAQLPVALLMTARPELLERRAQWGDVASAHRLLTLQALDAAQGERLADVLLHRLPAGAEALRALLIEQSDGNPFYMEELVCMFIDDGVISVDGEHWSVVPERLRQVRVPATLVGVLQARLDALPAAHRLALQQASIVGHVFWDHALAAIDPQAPSAMPALRGRALVHSRDLSAFEGTQEESFHHHLLQQVTYDTVLKPMRRAGHAAAALWLAERVGDRPAEYLAITAEHYERAGDHVRALVYLRRAAIDAESRFANQIGLEYVERALNNPAAVDARERQYLYLLQQSMADVTGQRDVQETALAQRAAIAESLDDDALRADVLVAQAFLASRRSDEALALVLATRAVALAERSGHAEAEALALGQIAWSRYSHGEVVQALGLAQRALARTRQTSDAQVAQKLQLIEVQTLTLCAIIAQATGDFALARQAAGEALALARKRGLRRPQTSTLESIGALESSLGHYELALGYYKASTALAEEIGWQIYVATNHYNSARCHFELGDFVAVAQHLTQADAAAKRCENRDVQGRCCLLRGSLAAATGDTGAAHACFEQAAELFRSQDAPAFVCQVQANQALLFLRQGQLAQALPLVDQIALAMAGGLSLAATEDVQRPRLACHLVWAAAGDARAKEEIDKAHGELLAWAARAGDEASRISMLENIRLNREIVAAWQAAHRSLPSAAA